MCAASVRVSGAYVKSDVMSASSRCSFVCEATHLNRLFLANAAFDSVTAKS